VVLIVGDLKNSYASLGVSADLLGNDLNTIFWIIQRIQKVVPVAHDHHQPISFIQNAWDRNLYEAGEPGSPH